MKLSDILRGVADRMDSEPSADVCSAVSPTNTAEPEGTPTDKFLPPLQLKLELLKKASGVKSVYDEENDDQEEYNKMVQELRKNAGLSPIMSELQDDDLLDI
jgi:hypothetical protein